MKTSNPSRRAVFAAAADILAGSPPLAAWAAGGDESQPNSKWVSEIRRAGWPVRQVECDLPTYDTRDGRPTGRTAPQTITVVPGSWLRLLAARVGASWEFACRMELEVDEK